MDQVEAVNHPSHYNSGKIEVIDAIEDWKLSFNTGNAVKYISRAAHKGNPKIDLLKALWYIARELRSLYGVSNNDIVASIAETKKDSTAGRGFAQ